MELNFSVAGTNEVVDDMCRGRVAFGAAKPLFAGETLDNAAGRMDAAVSEKRQSVLER